MPEVRGEEGDGERAERPLGPTREAAEGEEAGDGGGAGDCRPRLGAEEGDPARHLARSGVRRAVGGDQPGGEARPRGEERRERRRGRHRHHGEREREVRLLAAPRPPLGGEPLPAERAAEGEGGDHEEHELLRIAQERQARHQPPERAVERVVTAQGERRAGERGRRPGAASRDRPARQG